MNHESVFRTAPDFFPGLLNIILRWSISDWPFKPPNWDSHHGSGFPQIRANKIKYKLMLNL